MKIYKDGNMWCIVGKDFKNLQESDAVFVTELEYECFLKELLERKIAGKNENGDGLAYTLAQKTMPSSEESIRDRFRKKMIINIRKLTRQESFNPHSQERKA